MQAIRRIGYTPVSAILDIVDNSIVAKANFIEINIVTQADPKKPLKRIINKTTIIDNGCGVTPERIYNSLTLGLLDSTYEDNSLSKFGFGLKSAGFS